MISPRCVVPVCCGFGLALAYLLASVFRASPKAGAAAVMLLVLWVSARETACALVLREQRNAFWRLENQVIRARTTPTLISDSAFALPLHFYGTPQMSWRLDFPVDFDLIHQYESDDSGEQNLWSAHQQGIDFLRTEAWHDVRFEPAEQPAPESANAAPCFQDVLVIARPDGWLAHAVEQKGFNLQVVGDTDDWARLGGIMTPMAHPETRLLRAHQPCNVAQITPP